MSETQPGVSEIRAALDGETLRDWVAQQRWFASKRRAVTGIEVVEVMTLSEQPLLFLALVQTRFPTGTHELYQLPLGLRPASDTVSEPAAIAQTGDWIVYDALADPNEAVELVARIDRAAEIETASGRVSFRHVNGPVALDPAVTARVIGVEQSNSSLVFDDRLVLKVFRKLESGINPELEVLRFLTGRGYPNIARLHGWYEYEGEAFAATLGVSQEFLAHAVGGWELALDMLESDPGGLLERLATLGAVTAELHDALASDEGDPAFSPQEPSQEALALLTATVDEDIERIFVNLPDDERVAAIFGRGQDVRERLAARTHVGGGGRSIRIHGDYHLGQTLSTQRGWVIIDFEGEPARPLTERRMKRSPLRDVASMLRSFAYVTSAIDILRGHPAPADFEQRARDGFLERYMDHVDRALLPAGEAAIANLLSIFELEKAIYELRYELDHRPAWVGIPAAGIARLLEDEE
jgi:trehalose synthase-fused probable maltokinase